MTVRYFSVASGIEGATVAWRPLGWTAVGFSEIDQAASRVLAHHYGSNMPGEALASNGPSRSHVAQTWAVRRLTPEECERLQGSRILTPRRTVKLTAQDTSSLATVSPCWSSAGLGKESTTP